MTTNDEADGLDPDVDLSARYPFGIDGLDSRFGGAPSGTLVHLSGHPDAGIFEFLYTSLAGIVEATHAGNRYEERVELDPTRFGETPDRIRYVSLRRDRQSFERAVRRTLPDEAATRLLSNLTFVDLTQRYFACLDFPERPTKRLLAADVADSDAGFDFHDYGSIALLDDLVEAVLSASDDELVVLDSVSALCDLRSVGLGRSQLVALLVALSRFASRHAVSTYLFDPRADEQIDSSLASIPTGRLIFTYDTHDIDLRQYVRVGTFNGMLGTDEQVRFRTLVTDSGFVVKDSRTIQPSERRY